MTATPDSTWSGRVGAVAVAVILIVSGCSGTDERETPAAGSRTGEGATSTIDPDSARLRMLVEQWVERLVPLYQPSGNRTAEVGGFKVFVCDATDAYIGVRETEADPSFAPEDTLELTVEAGWLDRSSTTYNGRTEPRHLRFAITGYSGPQTDDLTARAIEMASRASTAHAVEVVGRVRLDDNSGPDPTIDLADLDDILWRKNPLWAPDLSGPSILRRRARAELDSLDARDPATEERFRQVMDQSEVPESELVATAESFLRPWVKAFSACGAARD